MGCCSTPTSRQRMATGLETMVDHSFLWLVCSLLSTCASQKNRIFKHIIELLLCHVESSKHPSSLSLTILLHSMWIIKVIVATATVVSVSLNKKIKILLTLNVKLSWESDYSLVCT